MDNNEISELDLTKKKKKSKPVFDPEAAENVEGVVAPEEELEDLGDLLQKKKKKKKKAFNLDDLDNALPVADDTTTSGQDVSGGHAADAGEVAADAGQLGDDDLDFNLPLRKKKKKKVTIAADALLDDLGQDLDIEVPERDSEVDFSGTIVTSSGNTSDRFTWLGSDRDYTYDELLQLVFDIIQEKNPDFVAGEKRRLVMRPPQVLRAGTKKTSFANFVDICKSIHRQPNHMQQFLLAELGTTGSVDANNQLIIKGRFQQKQIESVLRKYIKEYVACQTCRSPDTILQKDTRLFFLQCESCGSRRSVASIKSGFQALTSKRAAIRAKTA